MRNEDRESEKCAECEGSRICPPIFFADSAIGLVVACGGMRFWACNLTMFVESIQDLSKQQIHRYSCRLFLLEL